MKAKLIKNHYGYAYLLADENGNTIATSDNSRLSLKNCDSLFGVVDVDGMMKDILSNCEKTKEGYIIGFQMAMALNKDKVFSEDDVNLAFVLGKNKDETRINKLINSRLQPTEIEVEIESKIAIDGHTILGYELDSEGCLILKKL
jgi:hypothetical protein